MRGLLLYFLFITFFSMTSIAVDKCDIKVENAWIRSSLPPSNNAAIYMTISNMSDAQREIVGAISADLANNIELHQSYVDESGVSKVVTVTKLVVPPLSTIELKPAGPHIALMDLRRAIKRGDKLSVKIIVDGCGVYDIDNISIKDIERE